MKVTITPRKLSGTVQPPSSKSQSHRLIIAAALAKGESRLHNISPSQDITATLRCMTALGARAAGEAVYGVPEIGVERDLLPRLDCGESGSTLRFLIPVALAVAGGGIFTGHGRLMERPMEPYKKLFREKGVFYQATSGQITVKGTLKPGTYQIPGNISSQFITGLLYALPLLAGDSELVLTTPLESAAYVDMTLEALGQFGVDIQPTEAGWHIPGHQRPQGRELTNIYNTGHGNDIFVDEYGRYFRSSKEYLRRMTDHFNVAVLDIDPVEKKSGHRPGEGISHPQGSVNDLTHEYWGLPECDAADREGWNGRTERELQIRFYPSSIGGDILCWKVEFYPKPFHNFRDDEAAEAMAGQYWE